ncbi:NAD-dependent dehydratase [Dyadobacter psychrotolerans]|uniref:NAD-dependent dehydratase n=1 Tax=Dyadobacter psychrotolerans TaxID=2541721 RepID=A0A4R5DNZ8_9BACT|nr:NAD-dependent dehydratase [Dyadobacter psychrotolerans]TDE12443.1 NAD-dependent dehydratase [Dyadobacter psychrotolerans]
MNKESKIEKKRVSILGCGWLGLQLAKRLQELDITSEIKGSTTSAAKLETFQKEGIQGVEFSLNPEFSAGEEIITSFFDSDFLVISIPPRLGKHEPGFHPEQIAAVVKAVQKSPVQEIIFISSTGIYPDLNRVVTEQDVTTPDESAAPDMVSAENLLFELRENMTVSVLRFGGLIGYERIPGKYVKGLKNMTTGSLPVNYIHPDDAVEIIITIMQKGVLNETFNIVAPSHPTRREVYESTCAEFNWEAPTFSEPEIKPDFKIISADKFSTFYKYSFRFPDPLYFKYQLPEN